MYEIPLRVCCETGKVNCDFHDKSFSQEHRRNVIFPQSENGILF